MSEFSILLVNLSALLIAYLFVYPKFAGNDVQRMAWLDVAVGAFVLVLLAPFNWNSPNDYSFFVFELNWWIFTIVTYALLELPLFFFYVKARGLGKQYLEVFKSGSSLTSNASRKAVEKQLNDTKWNGLRSRSALRFLVIGSNLVVCLGTFLLIFTGDNIYSLYVIFHIIFILVFWFLLRQAVRLIPEAPKDVLDERMLKDRNNAYYTAYQILAGMSLFAATVILGYSIFVDNEKSGEGFSYSLEVTWLQLQAMFWFVYAYIFMLPSMVMAWREAKRLSAVAS